MAEFYANVQDMQEDAIDSRIKALFEVKELAREEWSGTLRDFLTLLYDNPHPIGATAHERLYDTVCEGGVEYDADGNESYPLLTKELFGIDDALKHVVAYFKASSRGFETRRRILLLYGPPSSGKSQLVTLLKRSLEDFSHMPSGAVYAIADCPQNDSPLLLFGRELRRRVEEDLGIAIEGDVCPQCNENLKTKYSNDIFQVPTRRIFFSEKDRVGIGSFVPSDPKSQDIGELIGSMNLSTIGEFGSESKPGAWSFDGELNIANRGVMEFIEMLKADERFLYVLLTLSQEQNVKAGRFPLIHMDECVVAHTNEAEFNKFMGDAKNEALQDRVITVCIPYNLKVSQEVRIHEKLLRGSNLKGMHIAPHALEVASIFGVLSRLEAPTMNNLTLIKKMKLYDGQEVEGFRQKDVRAIKEQTSREGMDGVSPRFIINQIATALIRPGRDCVNPIDVLRVLKEAIDISPAFVKDRERLNNLIADTRREYDEMARNAVQKAFFISFDDEAKKLLNNYLDNVEAFLDKTKLEDPITGEEVPPDEKLMRSVEEKIQIAEPGKESFRNEIFRKVGMAHRAGQRFEYTTHEKLKEAIEKQLFEERRDTIRLTISERSPDTEALRKLNSVIDALVVREGYCSECANELLKYVSSLIAREK